MNTCARGRGALGIALAALVAAGSLAAAKPKLDPESAKFIQSARLIMTREEVKIFDRLPDAASRKEFIADFWLKRNPDPDSPDNTFKREFEARVEYVNKRFNKEGGLAINTDRGRVYILMGPPDKEESFPPQPADPRYREQAVRGFTYWWSYYDDQMAVEFTDATGNGKYTITDIVGDFWSAMDFMKLGTDIRADDVFSKKLVKFECRYDAAAQELEVGIPAKALMFRENDQGRLQVDLRFLFYIYPDEGTGKESFSDARSVVVTDAEREAMKTAKFRFARALKPGMNYVDVIVTGKEGMKGKIRQIFDIKVPGKS